MKFIIVDDSEYYRKQLTAQVNAINGYEVVAAAQSGAEMLELIPSVKPAVVLADINLPDMNVMDAAKSIIQKHPKIHFLCITQSNICKWIFEMQQIGIKGYLYKTCAPGNIEKAVSAALLNQFYVDEEIMGALVQEVEKFAYGIDLGESDSLYQPAESLMQKGDEYNKDLITKRELVILSGTRNGLKVSVIAGQLGLCGRSISFIKEGLREKLNVRSNPELVPEAIKNGLIT